MTYFRITSLPRESRIALFAISTLKENGMPNIAFHSWSCFQGDKNGYFVILSGLLTHTHTYKNILRTKEFCVNFLSSNYYDNILKTIKNNHYDEDEFLIGGFSQEKAAVVNCPRIAESFLSFECVAEKIMDISGAGLSTLIIGRVVNLACENDYAQGLDKKYTQDGFMFNIHSPKNLLTGESNATAVATLKIDKII
jgi:flavin reductase (DIM6/NTAB) family NADH-FMN oxidoreductase RutF